MTLEQWALKWGVPHAALVELRDDLGHDDTPEATDLAHGEAYVQSAVRLACSRRGWRVWRNNIGAGRLEGGSFVRWGLANDSTKLNESIKSADLIGIRPLTITPHHVGSTIGQFVSLECKPEGWRFSGTAREIAQDKWAQLIRALGGHSRFTTGAIE
jgi:hypothetical protein